MVRDVSLIQSRPSSSDRTLSHATFPFSLASYSGSTRKTTSMRKTTGVFDPLAFQDQVPLVSHQPSQVRPRDSPRFFRHSFLEGFIPVDQQHYGLEFTPQGPKLYAMESGRSYELLSCEVSSGLFVKLSQELAEVYAGNPNLEGKIHHVMHARNNRLGVEFLRTHWGFTDFPAEFFFAVADRTKFEPVTRVVTPRSTFTLIEDLHTAMKCHNEGRTVLSSGDSFIPGLDNYFYRGFDYYGRSFILAEGRQIDGIHAIYLSITVNGHLRFRCDR
ncbi:Uncharacterised protein [Candidatus Bilamarchaeum dharawalense]|uniref:Uncharacterized protein n=1 Tax=Candidatus Bilamarchaeum dharawalense TaxID=2885759 RepID=A0A5E4LUY4_9ARCH|nr:Uncharacterised protein [Candidatus Bilamarchaeum dharawalense]